MNLRTGGYRWRGSANSSGWRGQAAEGETEYNKMLMNMIDELYTDHPFLGSRKMAESLKAMGCEAANRKRIQRLMGAMGLEAVYPKLITN